MARRGTSTLMGGGFTDLLITLAAVDRQFDHSMQFERNVLRLASP